MGLSLTASTALGGCGLVATLFSSPPVTLTNFYDATFNLQTETVTSSCYVNQNSVFGQLFLRFSDNSTATRVVYWNAPKTSQTTYLNINTSGTNDFHPHVTAAINAWSNTLNSPPALPANKYYSLLPQEVTSSAAVNTAEGTQDPTNANVLGVTSFGLDDYGNYISQAKMTFYTQAKDFNDNPNNSDDARYNAALHEIGHAMGLAHNSQRGSVMYPEADNSTNSFGPCYHYASTSAPSIPYDTAALENKYDPVFKDTSNSSMCGTRLCLDIMRHVILPTGIADSRVPIVGSTGRVAAAKPGLRSAGSLRPMAPSAGREGTRPVHQSWIMVNEFPGAVEASAEDLVLASTLVAQVKMGPRIMSVSNGSNNLVVSTARVTQTFRHLLGPDDKVKAGDEIAIVDLTAPEGGTYIDDPPLPQGEVPIVLLKHASAQLSAQLRVRNLYAFTSHFTSKWGLDRTGKMRVLSARQSRISAEISGYRPKDLFTRLLRKYGQASYTEETALRAALSARGVRTPAEFASYRQALSVGSPRLLKSFAQKDDLKARHTLDFLVYHP